MGSALPLPNRDRNIGILTLNGLGNAGVVYFGRAFNFAAAYAFGLLRGHFGGNNPRIEIHVFSRTPEGIGMGLPSDMWWGVDPAICQRIANRSGVLVVAGLDSGSNSWAGAIRNFVPEESG